MCGDKYYFINGRMCSEGGSFVDYKIITWWSVSKGNVYIFLTRFDRFRDETKRLASLLT